MLLVRRPCAQYSLERERVEKLDEIQQKLKENENLFKYVQNATGKIIKTFEDVQDVYTTLQAEVRKSFLVKNILYIMKKKSNNSSTS